MSHELFRRASVHRLINTTLGIIVLLAVLMDAFTSVQISHGIADIASVTSRNTEAIATVKASQDLYRQQYLDYIKDVLETMKKLQQENDNPEDIKKRGIKVPKWPVPRSIIDHPTTEQELRSLTQSASPSPQPTLTPIIKIQTRKVYVKPKPKPTPKSFKWPWKNPSSTR